VRNLRAELNLPPGQPVPLLLSGDAAARARLASHEGLLQRLARLASLGWVDAADAPQAAVALVGELTVRLPLAGLVDPAAEVERLGKEIAKLEQAITRAEAKLANPAFVDKAPADVVATERARLAEFADQLGTLRAQRERMAALAS
jgi:valyl-tRNA synthetase